MDIFVVQFGSRNKKLNFRIYQFQDFVLSQLLLQHRKKSLKLNSTSNIITFPFRNQFFILISTSAFKRNYKVPNNELDRAYGENGRSVGTKQITTKQSTWCMKPRKNKSEIVKTTTKRNLMEGESKKQEDLNKASASKVCIAKFAAAKKMFYL